MSPGLLAAALIAISPFAAEDDFYGQNPVYLLNDPKIAPLVGLTEEQRSALQGDLNDSVRTSGDWAKLKAKLSRLDFERKQLQRQGVELETDVPTFEKEFAEFDAKQQEVKRTALSRLSPEQTERLREISFQLLGLEAFMQRHGAKFGMTSPDFAMASSLMKEFTAKFREQRLRDRTTASDQAEAMKTLAAFERELIDKTVSQLHPETRAAYEGFAGQPIQVTKWELRTSFGIEPIQPAPAAKPPAPAP